jgi:hypothetical protein
MNITIQKFQELAAISSMPLDETDRAIKLVQVMTGKTVQQVEDMPIGKFNELCAKIAKVFDLSNGKPVNTIKVGKKYYHINHSIDKMTAGRYVEVATFSSDVIGNLHKIMASIVQPKTWYGKILPYDSTKHEEYADDMLQADFSAAYHSAVFFYVLFRESIKNLQGYFLAAAMEAGKTEQEATKTLTDLQSVLGGFTLPRWCENLSISV